jgi:hypothetical protein
VSAMWNASQDAVIAAKAGIHYASFLKTQGTGFPPSRE